MHMRVITMTHSVPTFVRTDDVALPQDNLYKPYSYVLPQDDYPGRYTPLLQE